MRCLWNEMLSANIKMKYYILCIKLPNNQLKEIEKSTNKARIEGAKKRYENIYKSKNLVIITRQIKV